MKFLDWAMEVFCITVVMGTLAAGPIIAIVMALNDSFNPAIVMPLWALIFVWCAVKVSN